MYPGMSGNVFQSLSEAFSWMITLLFHKTEIHNGKFTGDMWNEAGSILRNYGNVDSSCVKTKLCFLERLNVAMAIRLERELWNLLCWHVTFLSVASWIACFHVSQDSYHLHGCMEDTHFNPSFYVYCWDIFGQSIQLVCQQFLLIDCNKDGLDIHLVLF